MWDVVSVEVSDWMVDRYYRLVVGKGRESASEEDLVFLREYMVFSVRGIS